MGFESTAAPRIALAGRRKAKCLAAHNFNDFFYLY